MKKRGILIGVAGGTGSGKTLIAQRIIEQLGSNEVVVIQQDSYYKDLSHLPFEQRKKYNFDHPSAFDKDALLRDLNALLNNQTIQLPIYNYVTHTREPYTVPVGPHTVIVLDGILVLEDPELRALMDIKVYVDTDADIRLARRIRRDILERGRDIESVLTQYENTVRVMHLQFIEPSKRYADVIIPEGGYNTVAIDLLVTKIRDILQQRRISL
ncbi:MAG: uridine kinase [bacterium]|nr:uridine kinase [bacterium]